MTNAQLGMLLCLLFLPGSFCGEVQAKGKRTTRYIALSTEVTLYSKPKLNAYRFSAGARAKGKYRFHLLWQVVTAQRDWVKIRLPTSVSQWYCYKKPALQKAFSKLSWYVRKADVGWVTQKPLLVRYTDGTWFHLAAGVVLRGSMKRPNSRKKQWFWGYVKGWRFRIRLAPRQLGQLLPLVSKPLKSPGGGTLCRGVKKLTIGKQSWHFNDPLEIFRIKNMPGRQLQWESRCVRWRAHQTQLSSIYSRNMRFALLGALKGPGSQLAKGSRIYWPNGNSAGRLSQGLDVLHLKKVSTRLKKRMCFAFPLMLVKKHWDLKSQLRRKPLGTRPRSTRSLALCFKKRKLKKRNPLDFLKGGSQMSKNLDDALRKSKGVRAAPPKPRKRKKR